MVTGDIRILLIEDNPGDAQLIHEKLALVSRIPGQESRSRSSNLFSAGFIEEQ